MSTGHCIKCQVAVLCLLLVQSSRFVSPSPTPLSLVTKTANAATTVGSTVIGTTDATGDQTLPSAGSSVGSSVSQDRLLQTSPGPRSIVTATTFTALGSITLTSSAGPSTVNHRPSSSHPFLATTTGIQAPATATTIVAITTVESRPATEDDGGVVGAILIAGQPLAQHRSIVTAMDERLESLDCELPMVPHDSRLWKGNETQELLLPISIPSDCSNSEDCPTDEVSTTLSWEGTAEIQSGDVLLVRIDDVHLIEQKSTNSTDNTHDHSPTRLMHEPTTAVYQVTRTGHDNCDVTEGILLDITPLKIDNRKVVTLYDKDLTEGMNLLIVVSELWGNKKCVRLKVVVKSDNCGENEDCSGKGLCYSNVSMEGYECQCCPGFVGSHCEEKDACYPSPCRNNGICVDLSQGHEGSTFQCLCPYGYTGKTCEEETDPCTSMPCQNGATCTGNVTQFKCACLTGFSGQQCQHNMNVCESSPCVHGICMGQEDSFICYCEPGYTGTHCEYEYNECESSPCINGGTCTDHVAEYSCSCGRGFTGKRCHIKVDLCEPNPCPEPLYCLDRGNNYSCECPKGYTGIDCLTPSRPACSTNPCNNGGTCWSSMDSFYCACRPGFTGTTCEDEFVVETITNMDPINKENELVLKMPISIHLDHLHNLYIAAGTLACAFVFVALIVTVCHCRVNKPYKRFSLRTHPLLLRCKDRDNGDGSPAGGGGGGSGSCGRRGVGTEVVTSTNTNSEWFSGKDKALMATPSRSLPSLDTTDMYYTLDFSDSQSSPLIQ